MRTSSPVSSRTSRTAAASIDSNGSGYPATSANSGA